MPVLNIQLNAEAQGPNGEKIPVPPAIALLQRGPIVQVSVGLEQQMARRLLQEGKLVPTPIEGLALIDTGATTTCIDEEAASKMGLPVIDVATMASASEASSEHNVHPISLIIVGSQIMINVERAMGAALAPQGLLVLIGRDVLVNCSLVYNGPAGSFSLAM